MKIIDKIMRKIGYISVRNLYFAAEMYDFQQTQRASVEDDWVTIEKGIAAKEFIEQLINEGNENYKNTTSTKRVEGYYRCRYRR